MCFLDKRNITSNLLSFSLTVCCEVFFMHSYSPISILHWTLFVWSCMAVYMLCVLCICARMCHCHWPTKTKEGPLGREWTYRWRCTHLCAVWEGNKGEMENRERRKKRRQQRDRHWKKMETRGEKPYPSAPGRQPSAQIRPMGTHSLYTCSNQLATTTCLSRSFTLRHTHSESARKRGWGGGTCQWAQARIWRLRGCICVRERGWKAECQVSPGS